MEFEIEALCYEAIVNYLDGRIHYPEELPVGLSFYVVRDDRGVAMIPFTVVVHEMNNKGFFPNSPITVKITVNVEEVKDAPSDQDISTPVI